MRYQCEDMFHPVSWCLQFSASSRCIRRSYGAWHWCVIPCYQYDVPNGTQDQRRLGSKPLHTFLLPARERAPGFTKISPRASIPNLTQRRLSCAFFLAPSVETVSGQIPTDEPPAFSTCIQDQFSAGPSGGAPSDRSSFSEAPRSSGHRCAAFLRYSIPA